MQPKRRYSYFGIALALIAAIGVCVLVALMTKDIQPTQTTIEKPLDANSFLNDKLR